MLVVAGTGAVEQIEAHDSREQARELLAAQRESGARAEKRWQR